MLKSTRTSVNHFLTTLMEEVWACTKTLCVMRATLSSHLPSTTVAVVAVKISTTIPIFNLPLSQSTTILSVTMSMETICNKNLTTLTSTASIKNAKRALSLSRNEQGHYERASSFYFYRRTMWQIHWLELHPLLDGDFLRSRKRCSFWESEELPVR